MVRRRPPARARASWEQVSRRDIQRWMAWLLDRYSSAYASNQYRALQQFFKWLAAEDQLPDPMAGLQPPRVTEQAGPGLHQRRTIPAGAGLRGPAASPSAATPRSSRCSPRPASGWPSWPGCGTTPVTRGAVTSTCGSGRSPSAARAARTGSSRSATRPPAAWTGTCGPAPGTPQAWRPQLWLGVNNRGPLTAAGIYQMIARRGRQSGWTVYPHRFRHHFSHTWLDRGGAERDLMELNGWTSPQMLTPLRRQRPQRPRPPQLRPHHGPHHLTRRARHPAPPDTWRQPQATAITQRQLLHSAGFPACSTEYLLLSRGGRHCRIEHRSARSGWPSALPAESCGTGRGWSSRGLLVIAKLWQPLGCPARS